MKTNLKSVVIGLGTVAMTLALTAAAHAAVGVARPNLSDVEKRELVKNHTPGEQKFAFAPINIDGQMDAIDLAQIGLDREELGIALIMAENKADADARRQQLEARIASVGERPGEQAKLHTLELYTHDRKAPATVIPAGELGDAYRTLMMKNHVEAKVAHPMTQITLRFGEEQDKSTGLREVSLEGNTDHYARLAFPERTGHDLFTEIGENSLLRERIQSDSAGKVESFEREAIAGARGMQLVSGEAVQNHAESTTARTPALRTVVVDVPNDSHQLVDVTTTKNVAATTGFGLVADDVEAIEVL